MQVVIYVMHANKPKSNLSEFDWGNWVEEAKLEAFKKLKTSVLLEEVAFTITTPTTIPEVETVVVSSGDEKYESAEEVTLSISLEEEEHLNSILDQPRRKAARPSTRASSRRGDWKGETRRRKTPTTSTRRYTAQHFVGGWKGKDNQVP